MRLHKTHGKHFAFSLYFIVRQAKKAEELKGTWKGKEALQPSSEFTVLINGDTRISIQLKKQRQ